MANKSFWDTLNVGNPNLNHSEGYFKNYGLLNVEKTQNSSIEELLSKKSNKENRPIVVPSQPTQSKNHNNTKFHEPKPTEKPKTVTRKTIINQQQKKSMTINNVPTIPSHRPKEPLRPSSHQQFLKSTENQVHQKKITEVTSRMQNYAKIYAERKKLLIKKHSAEIILCQVKKAAPVEAKSQRLTMMVQRPANGNNAKRETKVTKKENTRQSKPVNTGNHGIVAKKSIAPTKVLPSTQVKVTADSKTAASERCSKRKEFYERQKQQQIDKKRQMEQIKKANLDAEKKLLRKQTEFKARPYKNPFKK